MTRILLVRHGETDWNASGRVQGWTDTPLNDTGRLQAACLAKRLSRHSLGAVFSSDLSRAQETAEIIAEPHRLAAVTDPCLRERSYGDWEGLTREQLEQRYPEDWYRYHHERRLDVAIPNGETWQVVQQRMEIALKKVLTDYPNSDDTVLLVGHGGSLRPLVLNALDSSLSAVLHLHFDNASLSCLEYRQERGGQVLLLNDTSHLADGS